VLYWLHISSVSPDEIRSQYRAVVKRWEGDDWSLKAARHRRLC